MRRLSDYTGDAEALDEGVEGSLSLATPVPNGRPRAARPLLRTWAASFFVIWLAAASWSWASPVGSAPDEPAHLIRAASLVRGELLGHALPHVTASNKAYLAVEAPEVFARLANDVQCFQSKPSVPASCQGSLAGSRADVNVYTYVGRYPPLYYALVGLPTLAMVSPGGIYLARLVSASLSAAMLALGVVCARRCRGTPLIGAGMALAVTPMTLYLAGVINPSGLEIASAITAWVAGMALVSGADDGAPAPVVVGTLGLSLMVLLLVRGLSPLWVACIAAALVAFLGRRVRVLARARIVQNWFGGCVVAGLAALAWDLYANPFLTEPGAPVAKGTATPQLLMLALERVDRLVTSSVGQFGWLDTPSPFAVIVTWLGALGAIVLIATCVASRRDALVTAGTLATWVVLPLILILAEARSEGIVGQGRDFMGLAVGAPLVASAATGERFANRAASLRLSTLVVIALVFCQVLDFYGALRRNTVGITGPLDAFAGTADAWHPPVPALLTFLVFAFAVASCGLLMRLVAASAPSGQKPAMGAYDVVAASAASCEREETPSLR
ncbi:MAG TPA: DUF2142 domain-containing protein [Acidimicrobiales bacterium]|nr:DUF2142 domain-containing protein [Acidimicrobiales bacterium]